MNKNSLYSQSFSDDKTLTIKNKVTSFFTNVFKRKKLLISSLFILIFILIGIFGPMIAPYDLDEHFYDALLQPPSSKHWLGTDNLGRDILTRLIYGTGVTLKVATIAVSITLVVGTVIGLISGYFGGVIDSILMRAMDVLLALPSIILAMSFVAILGASLTNAMIAVGIASIPSFARLTRGATLSVKSLSYVEASQVIGSSNLRIIFFQILPNIMSMILVYASLNVGIAILDTTALSFIGLGAQPPTAEWGSMLSNGREFITQAWWIVTFPGIAITMIVFSFNIFGEELNSIYDPKLRER